MDKIAMLAAKKAYGVRYGQAPQTTDTYTTYGTDGTWATMEITKKAWVSK